MLHLFEHLKQATVAWREQGYVCPDYPAIGEILAFQHDSQEEAGMLKFLREPQFLALEIYWYVRLILGTPHIIELYKQCYKNDEVELFAALGLELQQDMARYMDLKKVLEDIKTDEQFVKRHKMQTLHEAANLDYPSYVLALTMGAGKTVLIGTIIAIEFSMALHYSRDKSTDDGCRLPFMKNALVFAPGTTIIESLREIADIPYQKILPPELHQDFLANLKIIFVGDGKNKDIQAQRGSSYNLIVSNTEKISLRARVRKKHQSEEAFARAEVQANLRLQTIASLPGLGIFSDEAHHTYGNVFDQLKRVRQTIDYIHGQKRLIAVINTTGTPYHKKQPLKEVIVWYGLGDGIRDNILKNVNKGIHQYDMGTHNEDEVFADIIREFFQTYEKVTLPDGAKAKIAFYFKTQEHLDRSRKSIEKAMLNLDENVTQILVNTQKSSTSELNDFRRLNNPDNQKRVILLIGKGVEGWNCPSLFACALIKEQAGNNYVLQAATRCLRQVPHNQYSAKIFLDRANVITLNKELEDNFGTHFDLGRLGLASPEKKIVTLRVTKTDLPKLEITRTIARVVRTGVQRKNIMLTKPESEKISAVLHSILTPNFSGSKGILSSTDEYRELPLTQSVTDCYDAAWKIANRYHVSLMPILKKLRELYPSGEIPNDHLCGLSRQAERQQTNYKIVREKVTEALALIRIYDEEGNEIFEKDGNTYVHRLRMLKRTYEQMIQNSLFAERDDYADPDKCSLSFHYTPYNFDSKPERVLFDKVLSVLGTHHDEVSTFLFTGGLTDVKKTDFHFEYKGTDNRYHRYFPDFVLIKKSGEFYIIEVKDERDRLGLITQAKKKAVERLQKMQPEKFKYEIIYTSTAEIENRKMQSVVDWVRNETDKVT